MESAALDGVYASDEFRMFVHKVLPCSKRLAHDWASCPFSHPGEKAKRRNIRTHTYDCEMCPEITKGLECKLGSTCPHSHNVFESWLHPQKYRTMMCKDRDKCSRAVCFFAHGPHELRTPTMMGGGSTSQQQQQHLQQQHQFQQQQFQQQQQLHQQQQQQQQQLAGFVQQGRAPSDAAGMAVAADSMQSATTAAAGAPGALQQQWQLMQGLAHLARAASCGSGNLMNAATSATAATPAPGAVSPHAAAPQAAAHSTPPGPGASALAAGLAFNNSMAAQLQTAGGSVGSSDMASVQQLLSSLVNEVNISRQEAQHSRDVAAQAHQQLRALTAALASPEGGGQQQQQQQAVVSQAAGFPAAGSSGGLLQGDVTMLPLVSGAFLDCSEASSASVMELSAMDCTPASSSNLSELTSGMFAGLQDASSSMYAAGGSGSGPLPQVLYGQAQAMSHASGTGAPHRMTSWAAAGSQPRGGPMQASTDANAAAATAAAYACALPGMQLMGGSPSALQRQQQQQAAMLAAAGLSAGAACVPGGSRTDLNTSAGDWLGRMPSGYFDMQR